VHPVLGFFHVARTSSLSSWECPARGGGDESPPLRAGGILIGLSSWTYAIIQDFPQRWAREMLPEVPSSFINLQGNSAQEAFPFCHTVT